MFLKRKFLYLKKITIFRLIGIILDYLIDLLIEQSLQLLRELYFTIGFLSYVRAAMFANKKFIN